jgi:hypothetical protein
MSIDENVQVVNGSGTACWREPISKPRSMGRRLSDAGLSSQFQILYSGPEV